MKKEILTLEVYNPTGLVEITQGRAIHLDTLEGKTIGEISNNQWEADRTFPLIRQLLQARFPGIKIIPFTEFPAITVRELDSFDDLVKAKGCDAILVGNAA
ncbi:hypothetical protein ACFLX6_01970 [Chloroflexota bacterium]